MMKLLSKEDRKSESEWLKFYMSLPFERTQCNIFIRKLAVIPISGSLFVIGKQKNGR